jgi:hypothetical protein
MILFALMPKYLDQMYFVHLDYYGGLDVGQRIHSPERPNPPVLQYAHIESSTETEIAPVETLLLSPYYVNRLYNLPYVYVSSNPDRYELVKDGTMNDHFKGIFAYMVHDYEDFMKMIGKVGTLYLNSFGSQIKHGNRVVVPSLAEMSYTPIRPIRSRVILKSRNQSSTASPNKASTRRFEKRKSLAKKTLRRSRSRRRRSNLSVVSEENTGAE